MDTWITLLAIYGVMFFIKDSHMTEWVRRPLVRWEIFDTFFGCAFCVGWHAGWSVYLMLYLITPQPPWPLQTLIGHTILWAFVGAAWCWLVEVVIEFLQSLGSVHEVLDMVRALRLARLEHERFHAADDEPCGCETEKMTRPQFPPGQILSEGQIRRKPRKSE